MDPAELVDALRALTVGIVTHQQQQLDVQKQQTVALMAQQADLQAFLVAQQEQQQQQITGNQHRLRTAATASIPTFGGNPGESLEGWEVILNRVATAEQWDDANKQRVAVGK